MPKTYTTTLGDMWDAIALKELGGEYRKDTLMKCNLKYRNIYIFPANITLIIPDTEASPPPAPLPPWKRGGAV